MKKRQQQPITRFKNIDDLVKGNGDMYDDKLSRTCLNLDNEKDEKSYEAYPVHIT